MIAALYVDQAGPYWDRPDVDAWDVDRDATGYRGPWPVVAHPPCGPWGSLSYFCTKQDKTLAPKAVDQVRKYGGVLEHPAYSKLWKHCQMWKPGEWIDAHGGFSLEVEQVRWGHQARKRTWLYVVGVDPVDIGTFPPWREATHRIGTGRRKPTDKPCLWSDDARMTPAPFAEWLLAIAGKVAPGG